jgi:hypothetical protein
LISLRSDLLTRCERCHRGLTRMVESESSDETGKP